MSLRWPLQLANFLIRLWRQNANNKNQAIKSIKEGLDVADEKPRYDHIDPSKLKSPTDIALYEALVRHVDEKEKAGKDELG